MRLFDSYYHYISPIRSNDPFDGERVRSEVMGYIIQPQVTKPERGNIYRDSSSAKKRLTNGETAEGKQIYEELRWTFLTKFRGGAVIRLPSGQEIGSSSSSSPLVCIFN